ncbi:MULTISPECIES: DoxX family membrane protein [unclassified Imperialibacter]|uniref:DoxX family membrane protein n=1 Tax=unclassified Imperialibacter TaxID=2629706 RepID=UPI001251F2D7|nr:MULTISPECIES: DoxX family membrane protein [unclassified Imperialibacter]CAD5271928.1 DoxX family protein [Imperialibacter sp. 89]CAD5299128.1 DoxX family protein [Imperialibacter sp. 75]VVT35145.1 DoxX family protein [Imperialibacter sp. EC-SDR9]
MKIRKVGVIILRIVAAIIMLQTLYFKFTGAPESIYIFSTIGMEPWGRYMVGSMELVASVLLLIPKIYWLGGLLGMCLMAGALFFHAVFLGIEVQGDGGLLFGYAIVVFIASLVAVLDRKNDIPILKNLF